MRLESAAAFIAALDIEDGQFHLDSKRPIRPSEQLEAQKALLQVPHARPSQLHGAIRLA